jgi:hypothetical protein
MNHNRCIELPAQLGITAIMPIDEMKGDEPEDTALLLQLRDRASAYLRTHSWCRSILEMYFGDGVGGIVAVFLCRIVPSRPGVDEWLWVVVGDLPSAHFVTDDLKTPYEVLEAYISQRAKWVKFALKETNPPSDVMPIREVPATPEWAKDLQNRIDTLQAHILPFFRKE